MNDKCLNVVVYYDNEEEILRYLSELDAIAANAVDVCVVVNKDSLGNAELVLQRFNESHELKTKCLLPNENIGYMNALLRSIQVFSPNDYRYVILSNTDIGYPQEDFFQRLLAKQYASSIGCIAPSVYAPAKGVFCNPHYQVRIPKSKILMLRELFKHPLLSSLYGKLSALKKQTKAKEQDSCEVYSPHGCYMILSSQFAKQLVGMQYGAVLYSEESFIGEELLKHGLRCYYDSDIKIWHLENAVTGQLGSRTRYKYMSESLAYIYKEYYA